MLYLRNAAYLESSDDNTFTEKLLNLAVEEGKCGSVQSIADIPPLSELSPSDRILDCKGRPVLRALACGHHHIYSVLSRGMPPVPKTPTSFNEILEQVWWRLDKCLNQEMISASALACALYLVKNGVTFCIDHHASPFAIEGSLSLIAAAFERVGIGYLLCYESSNRDGEEIANQGLAEHERYFSNGGKGHVGLHASFTVDESLLNASVELARKYDTGIHIHVAEAKSDQEHCLEKYGKTVVKRLKDAGALDLPKTILGHCVHISEEDKAILAASPCWIAQNVESNQNNNVGLAEYTYSNRVMFGTDGMHSDMIRSAQSAYFSGISVEGLSPPAAYTRLRNVHKHAALHVPCGGAENNLIVLNYDTPSPMTQDNFLGHFFYGFDSRNVDSVISSGRVILENGRLLSANEEEILSFAREQAARLWGKLI